ncbi:ABC transporter permease [Paenibacillus arenosi]|uniref:ABC-2 family transporter protein n=1 Tax=Paenibacillus arenosi TaxID=2774142 RepID=A0ABR9AUE9_9BACL|nr:ABC-2 family transporter protein [Paenibacillus arenosi]MBD8497714.1 ABC-2 family transporter protein [Paenibacillus arenosi]
MMMKAYLAYCGKSFSKHISYRSEVWLRIFGNIVIMFIQISIWKSLAANSNDNMINMSEMVTYSIITTSVMNLLMTRVYQTIDSKLQSGDICSDLQKPISYPWYLFFEQLGTVSFQLLFNVVPSILIALLLFGVQLPEASHIFPFLLSLLVAMVISFLIGYLVALIAFWFLTTFALNWTLGALMTIFSGVFVPIWFFNPYWAKLASFLPFQYLGYIPSAIYLGKLEQPYLILIQGCGWIASLLFVVNLLWWKAIKRLIVQGG